MFFFISKLFAFLFSPLSWITILVILGFVPRLRDKRSKLFGAALVFLFLFSNSLLYTLAEKQWSMKVRYPNELKSHYRAIIVLGGFVEVPLQPDSLVSFGQSADRLFKPLRFLKKGLSNYLIVSGGSGSVKHPEFREATLVKNYLSDIGIADSSIIAESFSRNTYENALECKKVLDKLNIKDTSAVLLVTSAVHMKRSLALFKKQGIKCEYFVVNGGYPFEFSFLQMDAYLIPNARVLLYWESLIHEWVGYITYSMAGYL